MKLLQIQTRPFSVIFLFIIVLFFIFMTNVQSQSTESEFLNPCGKDLGMDFSGIGNGIRIYRDDSDDVNDYPDVDFYFSLCKPIEICDYGLLSQCLPRQLHLIPNCETSMLCAVNRTSSEAISILELSQYSFYRRDNGGRSELPEFYMKLRSFASPNATAFIRSCASNPTFDPNINVFITKSYTVDADQFSAGICGVTVSIASPAMAWINGTDPIPIPDDNNSSTSNTTAVAFAITLGILFFIGIVVAIISYNRMKHHLKIISSTAGSDEYQLREEHHDESDADEVRARHDNNNNDMSVGVEETSSVEL